MRPSIARRAADAPHSRAVGPETVPIGTASHDTFAAIRKAGAARIIPAGSLVRVPSKRHAAGRRWSRSFLLSDELRQSTILERLRE